MKVFYDPAMAGTDIEFDTTRKSRLVAESLAANPIDGAEIAAIHPAVTAATEALAAQVHDLNYLRALTTGQPPGLAGGNGFDWDPGVYPMAIAHAAGVVAAVVDAAESGLTGCTLSSGLHHARRGNGCGYCTINGIAVACWWVRLNQPDVRVGILDVDAHCGGGTAEMIAGMGDVTQVDVSVNSFDFHPAATMVRRPDTYVPAVEAALTSLLGTHPDIVIVNAGVDPVDHGITAAQLTERDHLIAERLDHCDIPAVVTLAGGYTSRSLDEAGLVDLHRTTIGAFAR